MSSFRSVRPGVALLPLCLVAGLVAPACSSRDKSGASNSASAAGVAASPELVTAHRRAGTCKFVSYEEENDARKATLAVALDGTLAPNRVRLAAFYYDGNGKQIGTMDFDSLAHEMTFEKTIPIGVPSETKTVECEIPKLEFRNRGPWYNENVVPFGLDPRKPGGATDAELDAAEGEKVTVEVVDLASGSLRLKNVSDKPTKRIVIFANYYAGAAGNVLERKGGRYEDVVIAPGATVDHRVDLAAQDRGKSSTVYEVVVSNIEFADGTTVHNRNLTSNDRVPPKR